MKWRRGCVCLVYVCGQNIDRQRVFFSAQRIRRRKKAFNFPLEQISIYAHTHPSVMPSSHCYWQHLDWLMEETVYVTHTPYGERCTLCIWWVVLFSVCGTDKVNCSCGPYIIKWCGSNTSLCFLNKMHREIVHSNRILVLRQQTQQILNMLYCC